MKSKEKNTEDLVKISKSDLLSLVAFKLKGRVLFPEKVESGKKLIQEVKTINY